jgi:hypothetical protein
MKNIYRRIAKAAYTYGMAYNSMMAFRVWEWAARHAYPENFRSDTGKTYSYEVTAMRDDGSKV